MAEANVRGEYEQEYEAPFAIAIRYLSVPRRRVQSPTPTGRGGFQSPIRTPPNPGRGDGRGPNGPPTDCRKEPIVYLTLDTDTSGTPPNRPTGRGGFQSPIRTPPNRPTGRGDGRGPNGPPTDCRKEPIVYLTLDTDTCPAWTPALPGEFEKIYRIFPFTNPGVKRPRI